MNVEQPRGKGTPGYGDLIFYDQYLRRYEQLNEKWCKFHLKLTFCVEPIGHTQNSPETFHFVPFGMPIERFEQLNCYYTFYLVNMETHIHIIFIKNGYNLENMISGS